MVADLARSIATTNTTIWFFFLIFCMKISLFLQCKTLGVLGSRGTLIPFAFYFFLRMSCEVLFMENLLLKSEVVLMIHLVLYIHPHMGSGIAAT